MVLDSFRRTVHDFFSHWFLCYFLFYIPPKEITLENERNPSICTRSWFLRLFDIIEMNY
uniref:Uncharacterized protein n=1 Tax=Rhizophora mucronata TaxID=61149 RepID=A0A2P2MY68_RHIMU